MSVRSLYPTEPPSLVLDFANAKLLDPRVTFTRTTNATYTDANGLVRVAGQNQPRFDHRFNPTTGEIESLGLLVEEQRTNLILQSEDFSTTWSRIGTLPFGSGSTVNAIVSPAGNTTADLITEDSSTNAQHNITQPVSTTGTKTFSVYAKKGPGTRLFRLVDYNGTDGATAEVYFNLDTGVIAGTSFGSGSIQSVGNGWYRCSITSTTTITTNYYVSLASSVGTYIYNGDGTSGVYIWGAQVESGTFPTSYIPTTSAQVTRNQDTVSISGSNFTDFYNPLTSSIVWRGQLSATLPNGQFGAMYSIDRVVSDGNTLRGYYNPFNAFGAYVQIEPGGIANQNGITAATNTNQRMAVRYQQNNFSVSNNGDSPKSFIRDSYPTGLAVLNIGSNGGAVWGAQRIRYLSYYPTPLSNAQLQALTR